MKISDISGASASIRHKPRYDQTDSLKVEDINDKNRKKTTRSTNPLEPVYIYKADAAYEEAIEIGNIAGSKPKARTHQLTTINNLNTQDIYGAQASTVHQTGLK